jgi:hypothetical protein
MLARHDVVQAVVKLLPGEIDIGRAERTWFCDVRRQGGWRLTDVGLAAFELAGIQYWTVPLKPNSINKKMLLEMNRRIQWPYYICICSGELRFFSDRDAMTARLFGDLEKWIKSYSIVRS